MKTPYITPRGHAALKAELDFLWRRKRPEVTQAVADAAALGDHSENAEYIYGKKQLREIDRRVRFLKKRLEELRVVDQRPGDCSRIYFGAEVTLEAESGSIHCYRLVGVDETDQYENGISIDAPLARALLGKQVDDEILVQTPGGQRQWFVIGLNYPGHEESAG